METKTAAKDHDYEQFEPFCQWNKEEGFDILEVHLPGFKRQDVRVQFHDHGMLTISGKQRMDEETTTPILSRFRKEIKVGKNCNASEIRAKFSHGILSISMPQKVGNEHSTQVDDEHSTWTSSISYYLLGLRRKVLSPKLSKGMATKIVVAAGVMALGGYAIYRFCK